MSDTALGKLLKPCVISAHGWVLLHSLLTEKYCARFFAPITLEGRVSALQLLHLPEVVFSEINLSFIATVLEWTFLRPSGILAELLGKE